jgi:proline iminopeptidase
MSKESRVVSPDLRPLYPEIEPYRRFRLKVDELHELEVEESGNPEGEPVVFLHGGPGGGLDPVYRRFFDPAKWRIVLFSQRGSGGSTPHACLENNTTWHLVADIETIREHLALDAWHVFGGSWGSTLSLAYASKHPDRIKSLMLRGIFLLRENEIRWFYQFGTSEIYPDAWEGFLAPIPEDEREDLLAAYHRRLTCGDEAVELEAAKAWSVWEGSTSKLITSQKAVEESAVPRFARAFARIECHYFANKGFFENDGWLLDQVDVFRHIPAFIVQGRYDVVCPPRSAWDLHRAWPEAEFIVCPDSGHSVTEPGIRDVLIGITDRLVE